MLAAPGPIAVTGFPNDVTTCLPDPAEHAGFTKDGAELGYCLYGRNTRCKLVDRAGKKRTMTSANRRVREGSGPARAGQGQLRPAPAEAGGHVGLSRGRAERGQHASSFAGERLVGAPDHVRAAALAHGVGRDPGAGYDEKYLRNFAALQVKDMRVWLDPNAVAARGLTAGRLVDEAQFARAPGRRTQAGKVLPLTRYRH